MIKKGFRLKSKMGIGAAVATAGMGMATASFLWLASGKGKAVPAPAYSVIRVIDGDTFETAEHQHIRVASTEAPELVSLIYTKDKFVNEAMLSGGYAYYFRSSPGGDRRGAQKRDGKGTPEKGRYL